MVGTSRSIAMGACLVALMLALSGCFVLKNIAPPELDIHFVRAERGAPACEGFGARFSAGEECHAVQVVVENKDERTFDLHELRWTGATENGTAYVAVAQRGADEVGPGATGNVSVFIAVPTGLLLTELRYHSAWGGDPLVVRIPPYGEPETA